MLEDDGVTIRVGLSERAKLEEGGEEEEEKKVRLGSALPNFLGVLTFFRCFFLRFFPKTGDFLFVFALFFLAYWLSFSALTIRGRFLACLF